MSELLWYVSRASGLASIVLLTAVLVLGLVTQARRQPQGRGATLVTGLHRTLALGMTVFIAAHVATAIADGYVSIDLVSALVPFTSGYETVWVGLGAIAVDLLLAVVITSVLRHRLPERLWRAVHWLTYPLWAIALVHGFALGTSDQPVLRGITVACAAIGVIAIGWRLVARNADRSRRLEIGAQQWA